MSRENLHVSCGKLGERDRCCDGAQDGTDASYPRNYHGVYLLSETVSRGDSRLPIPKNAVEDVIDVEGSAYGGFIWGIARQSSEAGTLSCGSI
jgi:hypothetical protein